VSVGTSVGVRFESQPMDPAINNPETTHNMKLIKLFFFIRSPLSVAVAIDVRNVLL
jgi:hypothetical protein